MTMSSGLRETLSTAAAGGRIADDDAVIHLPAARSVDLMPIAESLTLEGFGASVTYSRKVFIPLTQLCRDVCHYCTFAKAPRRLAAPYLSADQVRAIVRAGARPAARRRCSPSETNRSSVMRRRARHWPRSVPPRPSTTWSAWRSWCWRSRDCCRT